MPRTGNGVYGQLVLAEGQPQLLLTMYIDGRDQHGIFYSLDQLERMIAMLQVHRDDLEKYLMDRGSPPVIPGV